MRHFIICITWGRIKKYLSRDSLITLVHAFITSRLDYCNGLLFGLPKVQIAKLQAGTKCCSKTYSWHQKVFSHYTGALRAALAAGFFAY